MSKLHYIMLTAVFEKEDDGRWTAYCKELGTATFAHSLDEAQERLSEMIELHLNTLENVGERERFFEENGIEIKTVRPPKTTPIETPIDTRIFSQSFIQPVQYAHA